MKIQNTPIIKKSNINVTGKTNVIQRMKINALNINSNKHLIAGQLSKSQQLHSQSHPQQSHKQLQHSSLRFSQQTQQMSQNPYQRLSQQSSQSKSHIVK